MTCSSLLTVAVLAKVRKQVTPRDERGYRSLFSSVQRSQEVSTGPEIKANACSLSPGAFLMSSLSPCSLLSLQKWALTGKGDESE